jgi:hypothetical protein
VVVPPATTELPIKGTMAFDRKDYGMNKGIGLVKIADRVKVTVNLIGKRVSGTKMKTNLLLAGGQRFSERTRRYCRADVPVLEAH